MKVTKDFFYYNSKASEWIHESITTNILCFWSTKTLCFSIVVLLVLCSRQPIAAFDTAMAVIDFTEDAIFTVYTTIQ